MDRRENKDNRKYEEDDAEVDQDGTDQLDGADRQEENHSSGGKMLNYVLGGITAVVAISIAVVGWNFVDHVQKRTGELKNFHTTADEVKVADRFDAINKDLDQHLAKNPDDPEQALQETVFSISGPEIPFNKGATSYDQGNWTAAAGYFSEALNMIPAHEKEKRDWRAFGQLTTMKSFKASALERRAICYHHLNKSNKALIDINEALNLYPDYDQYYRDRADFYTSLGKRTLAAADASKAAQLKKKFHRHYQKKPDGSER